MFNLFRISLEYAVTLLAASAFLLGGVVNASGRKAIREEFVRYGFPPWWCWVTAALEIMTAVLLVFRPTFAAGVVLGACIMVAALFSVLRARDFRHVVPPAVFLLLLAVAAFAQFSSSPQREITGLHGNQHIPNTL